MALQSDSQGFLVGDPIDLGRMPGYLRDIKSDVAAIRKATIGGGPNSTRQRAASSAPANLPSRDSRGKFVPKANVATPTGARKGEVAIQALAESLGASQGAQKRIADTMRSAAKKASTTTGRDSSGRFTSNGEGGGSDGRGKSSNGAIAALANRLSALSGVGTGIEDVDPTVKAFQEVAEPMRLGLSLFNRADSKQEGLLRKIFRKLDVFHREESVYNKAAKKSLKAIEEKPNGTNGGSNTTINAGGGGIGGLLRGMLGGGMLGGLLSKAGRGAKGLLRRIPILGTLFAAGGAAVDVFGSESDPNLSRAQKDAAAGKSIGGWTGSLAGIGAGALAGSAFGPVGTIVGGVVGGFLGDQAGQIIGEKFGTWVTELRQADVPGKLVSAFESWTGGFDFQKGFELWLERTKGNFAQAGNVVGEQLNDLNTYVDKNTGINLKEMGGLWLDRTKDNLSGAWDTIKGTPSWLLNNTTFGKAGQKAFGAFGGSIPGMTDAQAAAYAAEVMRTESAGGDPRAENPKGFIGKYQMGAETLADTGLVNLGKLKAAQKSGRYDQKAFLADTANWNIPGGKEAYLSDSALQDKAFTDMQARNFTQGVKSGAISMAASPDQVAAYLKAAHLGGASGASDYFLRGVDKSDGNTLMSTYAKQGAAAVRAASVNAPSFKIPAMPTTPKISESPTVLEPLNSRDDKVQVVRIEDGGDVGRDLSDRGIAHITTGGYFPFIR
ncbi:hypothetical protein QZJ86_04250 [Methylomonas montana]|uniref:hypothetical protein n=1 Tax=Methylomonas montana TaxID=3058963 RepID=UPI002657CAA0|nr:hypothetical protein [Methylomonas montana]WKJ91347.1 hypothetical protein QZJ86_04250 [Methylomonas montana]